MNVLSFSQAPGGLNVVAPPGGTFAPPEPYMLFVPQRKRSTVGRKNRPSRQWPSGAHGELPLAEQNCRRRTCLYAKGERGNFVSGSVVPWNGADRTTTFVSSTQLTAQISAGDIAAAGTASVTVLNPGGAVSNALSFTITQAPPPPTLALTTNSLPEGRVNVAYSATLAASGGTQPV
jgi:hypothetical protein